MKYIIDVPNTQEIIYYAEHKMVGLKVNEGIIASEIYIDAEPYIEPDPKVIEDEVWEFAGKIFEMDTNTYAEIYDKGFSSYQDAKSKYEAWLKQKDEINIGDEIYSDGDYEIAVIMEIHGDESVSVYTKNGCIEHWWNKMHNLKKTGRHFDEAEVLLKKMRGEEL